MRHRRRILLLASVLLLMTAGISTAAPIGAVDGDPLRITESLTLSGDFYGSIDIVADGVTLDCAGHAIVNPGGFPFGVTVIGRTGVTVKNCHISGFVEDSFDRTAGILVKESSGNTAKDNVMSANGVGILVENSTGDAVEDNVVSSGGDGIGVFFSSNTEVRGNTSSNNVQSGIAVFQSSGSQVWDNHTDDNGQHGIFAVVTDGTGSQFWSNSGCDNGIADGRDYSQQLGYAALAKWTNNAFCTFQVGFGPLHVYQDVTLTSDYHGSIDIAADGVTLNCDGYSIVNPDEFPGPVPFGVTVIGQTGVTVKNCDISGFIEGISLTSTSDSIVVANAFSDNDQSVVLYLEATNNTVKDNSITDSSVGVWVLDGPSDNTIKDNMVSNNELGVLVKESSGNIVKDNLMSGNGGGIRIENSAGNNVADNVVSGGGDGIGVFFSSNTQVRGNTSSNNGQSGIAVFRSSGSQVWDNHTDNNTQHGIFAVVTDGNGSRFRDNTGCGNGIADGRDRSQPFGFAPAEWTDNTFCTFYIDPPAP